MMTQSVNEIINDRGVCRAAPGFAQVCYIKLRCRHTQTVEKCASSHKTNYIDIFSEILNHEGHLNRCISSKVTAVLLNGFILSTATGGVVSGWVCPVACAAGLFHK